MLRIGFIGLPGSGKTSTGRELAAQCRRLANLHRVELVAEYARRYISKYGIDSLWDQLRILKKQIDWEDSIPETHTDLLITDSPIFLGFCYALDLSKGEKKDIMLLNDLFSELLKLNNPIPRYDVIFHLPSVIKPINDGIRPASNFNEGWRHTMDALLASTFMSIFPPDYYIPVPPSITELGQRVEFCIDALRPLAPIDKLAYDQTPWERFLTNSKNIEGTTP